MPDNVVSNAGSGGPTWATDEIGGVHYPRMKLTHGADGVAVDASAAAPLPVVQTGTPALPTGAATDATLAQVVAAVDGVEAGIGAPADAAAASDAATSGLIGLMKRALAQITTLLSRIPALSGGRIPVDSSGVTQPVSATALPLPAGAATEATLAALSAKVPASPATDRATAVAPFAVRLSDGSAFVATLPVSIASWTGLTDAQLRAAAVPVSAASLPLPAGAATAANQSTSNASLSSIDGKLPSALTPGLLPVDTLATLGVARQLAAGAASANTALTTTCRRISIHANGAAIRFAIGTGAQTASATSHYIASGERLDLDVPANAQIGVIRAGATDGTLELSELV